MAIERIRQMTVEEYFAFDDASEYKSEYIDGEVYPMTGGTAYHAEIMINLGIRAQGCDCEAAAFTFTAAPCASASAQRAISMRT